MIALASCNSSVSGGPPVAEWNVQPAPRDARGDDGDGDGRGQPNGEERPLRGRAALAAGRLRHAAAEVAEVVAEADDASAEEEPAASE